MHGPSGSWTRARPAVQPLTPRESLSHVSSHTRQSTLPSAAQRGVNRNAKDMSPRQKQFVPMRNLRGIRTLEYLLPSTPRDDYRTLLRYGQSLLITRASLGQYTKHQ